MKKKMCVGEGGVRGIRTSREVFLRLFFGGCKYVCATLESQCWSKLNAESSLFYSFSLPCFLQTKNNSPVPSLQLYGSYLWVVQLSLSVRRCWFSLSDLMAASQYDQLQSNSSLYSTNSTRLKQFYFQIFSTHSDGIESFIRGQHNFKSWLETEETELLQPIEMHPSSPWCGWYHGCRS